MAKVKKSIQSEKTSDKVKDKPKMNKGMPLLSKKLLRDY